MTQTTYPSKGARGVIVDPARAHEVLSMLMSDYFAHKRLFTYTHRANAPQTVHRPPQMEVGSIDHARWLFFAAMTDRRDVSTRVYRGHRNLWETDANFLYNAPIARGIDQPTLHALLRSRGFGTSTTARDWLQCSATLFTWLHGDPRLMYKDRTIDDIVRMKSKGWQLSGLGPKILSLLAVFYAELEMIVMPTDAFPVDVHVQRFALSTSIIRIEKNTSNSHLEHVLRHLFAGICNEREWPVVEVSHAIWFLGNKLCTKCSRNSHAEVFCPARSLCGGPFETKAYFKRGKWDHDVRSPVGSLRGFGFPEVTDGLFSP